MLKEKIIRLINKEKFIPLDLFINICLTDPSYGYYTNHLPFGSKGDFTTAPEISQLFGEMLGFFVINCWSLLGKPKNFNLVELGPGYGTLMLDILNLIKKIPEFYQSLTISLLEISPLLQNVQKQKLQNHTAPINYYQNLEDLKLNGPIIFIANEFFDAMPIKQFKQVRGFWHEVLVTYNNRFNLVLNRAKTPLSELLPPINLPTKENIIFECAKSSFKILQTMTTLLKENSGCTLIIDYGYISNTYQNTIQAVKNHIQVNFLDNPGNADITTLVNFPLLQSYLINNSSCTNYKIISQKDFLLNLGIKERLNIILKSAQNNEKDDIISGVNRIIDSNMGTLFKVLAFSQDFNIFNLELL